MGRFERGGFGSSVGGFCVQAAIGAVLVDASSSKDFFFLRHENEKEEELALLLLRGKNFLVIIVGSIDQGRSIHLLLADGECMRVFLFGCCSFGWSMSWSLLAEVNSQRIS